MAIEATGQVETRADVSGYQIRNVNVRNALVVPLNETIETKLQLSPWRPGPNASSSHWTEFKVSSRNESGVWTANCTGLITTLYKQEQVRNTAFIDEEATENSELRREHEKMMQEGWPSLDPDEFYLKVNLSGFTLGPVFRGITKLHVHNYKSHFSMEVLDTKQCYPSKWEPPHLIHPAVLDVFVHVLISGAGNIAQINARIPVSAASLYISANFESAIGTRYHGFTSSKTHGVDGLVTDIVAFGEDGEKPLIALRGCQTVTLRNESKELITDGQYIGHVPNVPHLSPDIDVAPVTELQKLLQGKDLMTTLGHYISLIACKRPALEIMEYSPSTTNLLREALALRAGDLTIDSIKSVVMASEVDELIEESPSPSDTLNKLIHNRKLDVLEDFASQGFQDGTYDIVISTLACERSGDFSAILAGFKKLLKPCGVLLITGGFDTSASTDEALASAGFTSTKVKISNSPDLIISHQKPEPENQVRNVVMVTPQNPSDGLRKALEKVSRELEAQNYTVSRAPFGSITQQASPYLALITLDVDSSFLESLDDYSFARLRSLILGSSGTLWLTLDTYSRGLVKGFGRTIRAEHPDIPFVIMAIELHTSPDVEGNVFHIIRLLQNISNKNSGESTDSEYVIRGGLPFTERLLADAKLKSLMYASKSCQMLPVAEIPFHQATKVLRLSVREPGLLDTLEYVPVPGMSQGPIVDGQMEIEVTSVGLNFRDVMVAMGQMEDSNLGVECAGIVSRVGLGVEKFRVGDRVFGLHSGCFQTRVQVDPRTFERTPHDLSDEQAASLMCIYATVVRSLIDVARLERGESVLIHSAAGGVGQAAIRVAQFIGAEIFATVSSEKKKRFLVEKCRIQESHIFNSRDHSFADGILRLTKQRGVDVVLNSLAQEALRRTWLCVAPFGRFIELGKRNVYDNTGLEMRPFLNNITFAGVDILCQVKDYPDRIEKTNKKVVELLHKGAIAPLSDLMEYFFGEAEKAFRLMQSGGHIGKIVLSPPQYDVIPIVPEGLMSFELPHNRSYILVGGLGGIGRSIAKMFVKQGARHPVFLSRSGSSRPEAAALLCELQKQGVSATAISVDVADKPQLEAALNELVQTFPPIQGLIHCAMDLRVSLPF